jgi:molybdenum cofactor cytidylyltransferase
MNSGRIPAVLLAGGASSRMGRPKALLCWRDTTVLRVLVDTLCRGGAGPIVVVAGAHAAEIAAALAGAPATAVYNPRHAEGMLSSVRCGWCAVPGDAPGVLLALIDHPAVHSESVRSLLDAFARDSGRIILPTHAGRRGHPVVLPAGLRQPVMTRYDACGLRGLMREFADRVTEVPLADPAILQDLDTPDEYAAARP